MKTKTNKPESKRLLKLLALFAFVGLFVFTSCEDEDDEVKVTPVAGFTYVANELEVTFTNTSTDASVYAWVFGDGNTSSEASPVHTYDADGEYTVKLVAKNANGTMDELEKVVMVKKDAVAPVAAFDVTVTDLTATFTNTTTNATTYAWDFGDGNSSTEMAPEHTYAAAGTYTVTLTATGEEELTAEISKEIAVTAPILPVAMFTTTITDLKVEFANTSQNATSYSWDFGDGNSSTDEAPTHTYAADGEYTVSLTAKDDNDNENVYSTNVTVAAAQTGGGTVAIINGTFDEYDASGEEKDSDAWKAIRDQNNDDWECPDELETWLKDNVGGTITAGMSTSKNNGTFATKFHSLGRRIYQEIAVEVGKTYVIKFWARTNSDEASDFMDAYVFESAFVDENSLDTNLGKVVVQGTSSSYEEQTLEFTATTTTAIFYVRALTDDVDGFIDDVTIEEKTK